jgi:hypothetical protein
LLARTNHEAGFVERRVTDAIESLRGFQSPAFGWQQRPARLKATRKDLLAAAETELTKRRRPVDTAIEKAFASFQRSEAALVGKAPRKAVASLAQLAVTPQPRAVGLHDLNRLRTTDALIDFLAPRLQRLRDDANLKGSVTQHLDPFLAKLPRGVTLTTTEIEKLGIDDLEAAYLLFHFWRKESPGVFSPGIEDAGNVRGALKAAACADDSGTSLDPTWLHRTRELGDRPKSPHELPEDMSFLVGDIDQARSHATWCGDEGNVQLALGNRWATLYLLAPSSGSGWKARLGGDQPVGLAYLPTPVLANLRTVLAKTTAEGVPGIMGHLRALALETDPDARMGLRVIRTIDTILARRDPAISAEIASATRTFLEGGPAETLDLISPMVGPTSAATTRPPRRSTTAVPTWKDLVRFIRPRLEALESDSTLAKAVTDRIDPLLAALPKRVGLTARGIESLNLDEHETAYLLYNIWRRMCPYRIGIPLRDARNAEEALEHDKAYALAEAMWLGSPREYIIELPDVSGATIGTTGRLRDPKFVVEGYYVEMQAKSERDGAPMSVAVMVPPQAEWGLAMGPTPEFGHIATGHMKDGGLARYPASLLVEVRRLLDAYDGDAPQVAMAKAEIERVLDQRARPFKQQVDRVLAAFRAGGAGE